MRIPDAVDASAVLDHVGPGRQIVVPLANGEPVTVIDAIEAEGPRLSGVRIHQMHALHDRPYLHGAFGDKLRHVAYFLSPITRQCFAAGTVDVVPANFSEVPLLLRDLDRPLVVASVSPPDRHGYVSLGTNCDYVSSLIGHADFFVEANAAMPRTFGRGQIHLSQVTGWCEADYPLVAPEPIRPTGIQQRIGELVAERIPDGATLQTGIGGIPNAVLSSLERHRDLGVHTELLSDGIIDLVETGVITGVNKLVNRTKIVGTFALGTRRLYDFLHENAAVELWPVSYVNNPRVIAREPGFVSINSTLEVDLLGQCASESLGSRMWSGSGGQADFARGALWSPGGQGFIVVASTAREGAVSRVVSQLTPGATVTTIKNSVDKVVTEHGVAELRGRTVAERAAAMIAVAHPDHRARLYDEALALGFVRPGTAS